MKKVCLILLLLPMMAYAAPPPGHPSVDQISKILNLHGKPGGKRNTGRVVLAVNSNNYTFIKVENSGVQRWIAAPRITLQPGTRISYPDGRLIRNFYSKRFRHLFPEIMFVDRVDPEV